MSVEMSQNAENEMEAGFPSAELRQAREALGLSQRDAALELRLSDKYIDALERAAMDELPSLVFARGYVRSYSKLLKLDEERYLALFDVAYGRQIPGVGIKNASGIEPQARLGDPVIKWSAWLFVIVVIAASYWWWKNQQTEQQSVVPLPASDTVEVESVDGTTLVVEPQAVVATTPGNIEAGETVEETEQEGETVMQDSAADSVEPLVAEDQTETVVETEVAAESEQAAEDAVAADVAVTGSGNLRVTFTDECWVSVEDSTGEVLAMRVKPAGSELNVTGKAPLKVLLGRASAVDQVFFDGQPVEIDRSGRSGVVRLSLPANP